jgi:PTS system nitrogen regulatory IIA component
MPHRVMNVKEIAAYLHVAPARIELLVKQREIPFQKQGERFAFRRSEIDAWASQRILNFSAPNLADYHSQSSAKVKEFSPDVAMMPQLLTRDRIQAALATKTRSSVIRNMVAMAVATDLVSDGTELLTLIEEREKLCSTALPGGWAVLHPRHHDPYMFTESFMVVGRTIQPIHFGAQDGHPSDIFFLLCCQDDRLHLHTLARLCTLCMETKLLELLRLAETEQGMMDAILESEENIIRHL